MSTILRREAEAALRRLPRGVSPELVEAQLGDLLSAMLPRPRVRVQIVASADGALRIGGLHVSQPTVDD